MRTIAVVVASSILGCSPASDSITEVALPSISSPPAEDFIAELEETENETPRTIETIDVRNHRVLRWAWRDPADVLAETWNVPEASSEQAQATGLLRIWANEVGWANERDMIGIWQVILNIRARHCDRERSTAITECANGEETALSAMRRASRTPMGLRPPRSSRKQWIRHVELECQEPEGWHQLMPWSYLQERCKSAAVLAITLVHGSARSITPATIIAWGGRCEVSCINPSDRSTCTSHGACDDHLACRRGLARVPNTETDNAFWCRPGTRACPDWISGDDGLRYSDQICANLHVGGHS
jgi:hypothetical protein